MIKLGLANVKAAAAILGNPQDSYKSIHIAGTNGKGSVCTWLELMFLSHRSNTSSLRGVRQQDEAIQIGKYISPHLINVTERISVNGKDISSEDFNSLWSELYGGSYDTNAYHSEVTDKQARLYGQSLTEFEKLTLLAFEHFKRSGVQLAIIEVGLGGRLDATNILSAEQCLATAITNIGLDHQEYLGNTLEAIAREKRGIMKASVPHYEGRLTAMPPNDIEGSNYLLAKQIYDAICESGHHCKEDQTININGHCSDEAIQNQGWIASPTARNDNLVLAFNRRYQARFDESEPGIIVDGAHNPDGAAELNRYLRNKYLSETKVWIIGLLDKDHQAYLDNLFYKLLDPSKDLVIFTRVNNSRSKDPEELKKYILGIYPELEVYSYKSLEESLNKIKEMDRHALRARDDNRNGHSDDAIQPLRVITGSLYLCGEYLSLQA